MEPEPLWGTKVTRTQQEISARAELKLVIRLHKELESRASSERALYRYLRRSRTSMF